MNHRERLIAALSQRKSEPGSVLPSEGFGVVLFDTVSPGPLLVNHSRYHRQAYEEIQTIFPAIEPATSGHPKFFTNSAINY